MFEIRNRAYSDNDTPEIAGKFLPAHPINRYKSFSKLWQQTRKIGGYVPRPEICASRGEEYFPCCIKCAIADADSTELKETLAHRSALTSWLMAEWVWDFGFTLPEEFVGFGIGITIPSAPEPRDRVFVLTPDNRRSYLSQTLQEHASLNKGDDLHEAKVTIGFVGNVQFPGQIMATASGQIYVAQPRTTLFGQGKQVFERFIFQAVQMPYNLPILVHNSEVVVDNGKVSLMGIPLN